MGIKSNFIMKFTNEVAQAYEMQDYNARERHCFMLGVQFEQARMQILTLPQPFGMLVHEDNLKRLTTLATAVNREVKPIPSEENEHILRFEVSPIKREAPAPQSKIIVPGGGQAKPAIVLPFQSRKG